MAAWKAANSMEPVRPPRNKELVTQPSWSVGCSSCIPFLFVHTGNPRVEYDRILFCLCGPRQMGHCDMIIHVGVCCAVTRRFAVFEIFKRDTRASYLLLPDGTAAPCHVDRPCRASSHLHFTSITRVSRDPSHRSFQCEHPRNFPSPTSLSTTLHRRRRSLSRTGIRICI